MNRKFLCILLVVGILLSVTGISLAAKKKLECKAEKVEGNKVILDCGEKAKKIELDATYKLIKKIEGC